MKYLNKFIAAGLGFALLFTGTNFVYGMFTSSARQENIITIKKPNIQLDVKYSYFYGKDTGGQKYNALYIPVVISGIDFTDLDIEVQIDSKNNNSTVIKDDYITKGNGVHTNTSDGYPNDTKNNCVIINLPKGFEFGVKEKYNITIKATIKGNTKPLFIGEYWLQKQSQANDCVGVDEVRIQHIAMSIGHTNLNLKENIFIENKDIYNEEVKTNEPQAVEQPKEEVVDPSEPEVIEPSGEEIIKQPEVVEPPKETEDLQE